MKLLMISKYGQAEVKESDILPRVGDQVDMFYSPLPSVDQVVLWPSDEWISSLGIKLKVKVQAVVTVS